MKRLLAFILLAIPAATYGRGAICEDRATAKLLNRFPVSNEVNYFLRSAPGTRQVGFLTAGENGANFLMNIDTGKIEKVPGRLDPVLSPDGKVLSTPAFWLFDPQTGLYSDPSVAPPRHMVRQGMARIRGIGNQYSPVKTSIEALREMGEPYDVELLTFYTRKDGKAEGEWQVALRDPDANANYQSIGVLRKSKGETEYRALYEKNGSVFVRDYLLNEKGALGMNGNPRPICPKRKLVIPALGKKGTTFSAYEPATGKTLFISIGEKGDECREPETLPFLVGKADFSPDESRIGYHIDRRELEKIMRAPGAGSDLKAIIYDRKTKTQIPLPSAPNEDSYYPVFIDDSTVAFVSATRDTPKKFFINTMSLLGERPQECLECLKAETETGQLAALMGYLRGLRCHDDIKTDVRGRTSFQSALHEFSQMKSDVCKTLARECDVSCLKAAVKDLDENSRRWVEGRTTTANADIVRDYWDIKILKSLTTSKLAGFCESLKSISSSGPETTTR